MYLQFYREGKSSNIKLLQWPPLCRDGSGDKVKSRLCGGPAKAMESIFPSYPSPLCNTHTLSHYPPVCTPSIPSYLSLSPPNSLFHVRTRLFTGPITSSLMLSKHGPYRIKFDNLRVECLNMCMCVCASVHTMCSRSQVNTQAISISEQLIQKILPYS